MNVTKKKLDIIKHDFLIIMELCSQGVIGLLNTQKINPFKWTTAYIFPEIRKIYLDSPYFLSLGRPAIYESLKQIKKVKKHWIGAVLLEK